MAAGWWVSGLVAAIAVQAVGSNAAPTEGSTTAASVPSEPGMGASTGNTGSSTIVLTLIVLNLILILLMIITICLLIYYTYTRRNVQVGVVVTPSRTKTIKYNIYEPPRYEELDRQVPNRALSELHPNISPPALRNYHLSKVHRAEVDSTYDIASHANAIQDEADQYAILGKMNKNEREEQLSSKKEGKMMLKSSMTRKDRCQKSSQSDERDPDVQYAGDSHGSSQHRSRCYTHDGRETSERTHEGASRHRQY